jgi:molybdopterin-containing oxidoreductase family iron-sulfur binding subunit
MNKPLTDKMELTEVHSLVGDANFEAAIDRDFGTALENQADGVSRRRWLQLMGASLALGGAAGCRYQSENIAEFAFRPQGRIPGVPEYFASLIDFGGVAQPLLATSFDGRPVKLDGNPKHPCSSHDVEHAKFGASLTFTQARMLEFYDPDRLRYSQKRAATGNGFEDSSFDEIVNTFKPLMSGSDLSKVAVLAAPYSSPTLARMQQDVVSKGGTWVTYSSVADDNTRTGAKQAFGKPVKARYRFDKAAVIISIDADPLMLDPNAIANSILFGKGRDVDANKAMSRLYAVESQFSTTGGAADHRLSVPSSKIPSFVAALLAAVDNAGGEVDRSLPYRQRLLAAMAQDLVNNKGKGIILVGEKQPPEIHAAVHALNEKLGNNGATIEWIEQSDSGRTSLESVQDLAGQLNSKSIETLVIVGGNPVYDAPRELKFEELIRGVNNSVHLTIYKNETSLACNWISHLAHPLEAWKDGVAADGSILVGQPLINPLFGGKSEIETLATMLGEQVTDGQGLVRNTLGLADDQDWRAAVHFGFVAETAASPVAVKAENAPQLTADEAWSKSWDGNALELVFNPSLSTYDGQFANNSWMLELPNFLTKITWDNVANVSPRTAKELGLKQGTLVTLNVGGVQQKLPVNVQPGQAEGSIGVDIGWGRKAAGRVGGDALAGIPSVGHDVNDMRKIAGWTVAKLTKQDVVGSSTKFKLALVQEPWTIDKTGADEIQARMFRDKSKKTDDRSSLLREGSLESYLEFLAHHPHDGHDHDNHNHDGHANGHSSNSLRNGSSLNQAVARAGQLPIINPVAFVDDGKSDHHGHEDHHHWPEAFHTHHTPFDITKGVRENYRESNPEHTNVWGKTIDLNKCTGCNACVIACQSENNVPVVGKQEAWRGREMHWIRIDRYYGDNLYTDDAEEDDEILVHQPMACHHCENAPCETVCPVAATVHSSEGLNDMVYNRCIGTRYCGNNCPFKVRRFNYLNYSDAKTFIKYPGADKLPPGDLALQGLIMNPEVTVRSRGVMEKCTYCVQRIQNTKIQAKNERRNIGPNEITTACQDACPTAAIEFGDLNNKHSRVAHRKSSPRAYVMLEDLNIFPRTKYLARVRNVHPALLDRDDRSSVRKKKVAEKKT